MHTRNRPLKLCRWAIPNDVHRLSIGFRHRMFKSTIIYWDGTYRSQNYDRKNRAGSRHWLAAIGRACGSSGNVWERDTIWELTKAVIFLEGAVSKWERASHSGEMVTMFWTAGGKKYLQYLFTHDTLIVVRLAISITYRITLPSTAEFSILHFVPELCALVLRKKRRVGLQITWSIVLLLSLTSAIQNNLS